MDEEFRVDSPDGMLTFFVRAAEDVHRYVSRLTGGDVQLTEDIVQETFIALLRHQREGRDGTMHVGWLMTAARSRFIDHVRSRSREQLRIEHVAAGSVDDVQEPDYGAVSADQALLDAGTPAPQERLALALHSVDGLSIGEVAQTIGRSVEATTSLLARARRRLRALMMDAIDER